MRVRKNARLDTGTTELGRDVTLDLSEFLLKSIEAGLNRILPLSIVCKQRVQKSLVGNPGLFGEPLQRSKAPSIQIDGNGYPVPL